MDFFHSRKDIEKTRHKLPHWQQGRVPVFVTFRLADSLPQSVLSPLLASREAFLAMNPKPWDEATEDRYVREFAAKFEDYLDAGHGCCALGNEKASAIVVGRLQCFNAQRYALHAYVVMPNHVHVLFTPHGQLSLPGIVQAWKGVSSRMIHKEGLSKLDPFWQPDYFDRLVRSPEHFEKVRCYIQANPSKAGLKTGFVMHCGNDPH